MASWVSFGFVFAEKFKNIVTILLSLLDERKGEAREVFPTPESPVNRIGFLISSINSRICLYFRVSIVGTIISWYSEPFENSNYCSLAYQLIKLNKLSGFTKKSKRVYVFGRNMFCICARMTV